MRAERRGRRSPRFAGDGVDGTEDPREIDRDVDIDTYEPFPPLDSRRRAHYNWRGRD